ncbi:MAG: DUF1727 domain-containing protein, partial [Candidatus Nomurabacteria bacterium]|nr:DUF1727 domain-containing protein [Candidatus Nomurabacteria bacterium]
MKSPLLVSLVGKVVSRVSRLRGGQGSALPGLVAERIAPNFLRDVLGKLPRGVVVVSGTNGKTTTTKMTVELLRAIGLKVLTNPSGSNFTRGVASAIIADMRRGKLNADIAVVELDEAHAVHFVNKVAPRYALLLNVSRDQLDRFGDVDVTAGFLEKVAAKTTDTVILNREDPHIATMSAHHTVFFGYSPAISPFFTCEDEPSDSKTTKSAEPASVILQKIDGDQVTFNIGATKLKLRGAHNAFNAAGALALVKEILGEEFDAKKMLNILSSVEPAIGRGESFHIDGVPVELILVKNPSGFRIVLGSQYDPDALTMIAINNQIADGR